MTMSVPAAPRELTAIARRAAWRHPYVRFWWVVSAALLLGMGYLLVMQTIEWEQEVGLVKSGVVVDATVFEANVKLKNKPIPPLADVDVTYGYNGQTYKVTGPLAERKGLLMDGQTIAIRIDPENPRTWTNRTEPPAYSSKLFAPLLLSPPLLIALIAGGISWKRILGLWVKGEARQAAVVVTKQTPLAPLSQVARCALVDGGDKRLIDVYVPHRMGKVVKGERIWLVTQVGNPQRAVLAAVFLG
jgi:hypothetical protein